jgi:hypothetical protein
VGVVQALLLLLLVTSALLNWATKTANATALPLGFSDSLVANVAAPTALAFTPDGRMLIATQPGQLRIYANGALLATPALDLSL